VKLGHGRSRHKLRPENLHLAVKPVVHHLSEDGMDTRRDGRGESWYPRDKLR
jgi:hypothetical protein